jgi:hypothetical protein
MASAWKVLTMLSLHKVHELNTYGEVVLRMSARFPSKLLNACSYLDDIRYSTYTFKVVGRI